MRQPCSQRSFDGRDSQVQTSQMRAITPKKGTAKEWEGREESNLVSASRCAACCADYPAATTGSFPCHTDSGSLTEQIRLKERVWNSKAHATDSVAKRRVKTRCCLHIGVQQEPK